MAQARQIVVSLLISQGENFILSQLKRFSRPNANNKSPKRQEFVFAVVKRRFGSGASPGLPKPGLMRHSAVYYNVSVMTCYWRSICCCAALMQLTSAGD